MSFQSLLLSDPNHSFFVNLVLKQLILEHKRWNRILERKRKCALLLDIAIQKEERREKYPVSENINDNYKLVNK